MEIPLTSFKGFLKQINGEKIETAARAALENALPHFWAPTAIDDQVVRNRAEQLIGAEAQDETKFQVVRQARPNRRFSGGESLPRQRYFTISVDVQGHDSLTLASEISAYRSVRRSACCALVDTEYTLDAQLAEAFELDAADKQKLLLIFLATSGYENPMLEHLVRNYDVPTRKLYRDKKAEAVVGLVKIPYSVVETEIADVLDLRTLQAQNWLLEMVSGRGEKGKFPLRLTFDNGTPAFLDLLPWLINVELGGSGITEGVGRLLRQNGVKALIYPSARNDSCAIQMDSRVVKSAGWCLVDYRDAPVSSSYLIEVCDQTPFSFEKGTRVVAWADPRLRGSWATEGIRSHYRYRFFKEVQMVAGPDVSSRLIETLVTIERDWDAMEKFASAYESN